MIATYRERAEAEKFDEVYSYYWDVYLDTDFDVERIAVCDAEEDAILIVSAINKDPDLK